MTRTATAEGLLQQAVDLFVAATPPVGAPIEEWRAGFAAMAATFELPDDITVEEIDLGGVPSRRITAPGARDDAAILHFHSGGYVQGSSLDYREFGYRLSAATELPVLVPDYRLAPEATYPAAVGDGIAAYASLIASLAPERVVVSGDSAGGGLAMATLLGARDAGLAMPAAAVAISPLLDLAGEGESCATNASSDPLIDRAMIVEMGKVYIGDLDPKQHPLCSPLYGDHRDLPPLLLLASDSEVLLDDSVRFAAAVEAAGGSARVVTSASMIHIWTLFPFLPEAGKSLARIGSFVGEHIA